VSNARTLRSFGDGFGFPARIRLRLLIVAAALALSIPLAMAEDAAQPPDPGLKPTESETVFLDRLMMAESGGRDDARNPRSSALGPFQFLASTFLELMARHFAADTSGKTEAQILQLRADEKVARNAALLYTRENAAFLIDRGHEASAAHLRLAFLVGPNGALRVISAEPKTPVTQLLGAAVLQANPFLNGMTAAQLLARAADEAAGVQLITVPLSRTSRARAAGVLVVRCNLALPSCRKWLTLANRRQARRAASQKATDSRITDTESKKD
jgi:hypothetical protein